MKAVLVWFLDVYSDVSVIFAIMYSIDKISRFKTAKELVELAELTEVTGLDFMSKCNISNITELQEVLQVAANVLTKYIFQLRLVLFLSIIVQCLHGAYQMSITYGVFSNFGRSLLLFGLNMVAAPITNLKNMLKATTEFHHNHTASHNAICNITPSRDYCKYFWFLICSVSAVFE